MDCVDVSFQKDIIIQETYLIGEIIMWPKTSHIPKGFISCDGTSYSDDGKYNKLYGVIGYKFGGSSASGNFNIPNLNVSNTNTPILIKGDHNMNNSGTKELDTNSADISGGVNQIPTSILPSHNHKVSYNINTTISDTTVSVAHINNDIEERRAYKTNPNNHTTEDGGQESKNHLGIHFHNISYSGSITKQEPNYNINIDHTISHNVITGELKNVTPSVTKVHFIIFTGVYE